MSRQAGMARCIIRAPFGALESEKPKCSMGGMSLAPVA